MKLRGAVFSGTSRGKPYIKRFSHRLSGILGFVPFPGTLNIRLERDVDISEFPEKKLSAITPDGEEKVEAYFITVEIKGHKCYGMQIEKKKRSGYDKDVIELVSDKNLKKSLHLKDGDKIILNILV